VLEFTHDESGRRIRVAFTPDDRAGPARSMRGVYILSMDVTEEAQARAALAQTRKRELAAQLTSGLAHDFANLLTIILGCRAAWSGCRCRPRRATWSRRPAAAARRGGTLLDRLAAISGPRAAARGRWRCPPSCADLRALAAPSLPARHRAGPSSVEGLDAPLLLDAGALAGFAAEPDPERPRRDRGPRRAIRHDPPRGARPRDMSGSRSPSPTAAPASRPRRWRMGWIRSSPPRAARARAWACHGLRPDPAGGRHGAAGQSARRRRGGDAAPAAAAGGGCARPARAAGRGQRRDPRRRARHAGARPCR
jgi:hypothetical protein